MGAVEEGSKVAVGIIDSLKNQPVILALVILQVVILAVVLYSSVTRQSSTSAQFAQVYKLLEQCMSRAQ